MVDGNANRPGAGLAVAKSTARFRMGDEAIISIDQKNDLFLKILVILDDQAERRVVDDPAGLLVRWRTIDSVGC